MDHKKYRTTEVFLFDRKFKHHDRVILSAYYPIECQRNQREYNSFNLNKLK